MMVHSSPRTGPLREKCLSKRCFLLMILLESHGILGSKLSWSWLKIHFEVQI